MAKAEGEAYAGRDVVADELAEGGMAVEVDGGFAHQTPSAVAEAPVG